MQLAFKQGHQELLAQDHAQIAFEYHEGGRPLWAICTSAQSILEKKKTKTFSGFQMGPPLCQFMPIASCPVTWHQQEEHGSVFFSSSFHIFIHTDRVLP